MATVIRGDDNFDSAINGRVLQVGFSDTQLKEGLWTDTAQHDIVSVSFTPLSATSTVYIETVLRMQSYNNNQSQNSSYKIKVLQDTTEIGESNDTHNNPKSTNTAHRTESQTMAVKRATSSTSTRVYKMAAKISSGRLYVDVGNYGKSYIKITEVEA
tara:strand:- start:124 stop:594 length:471 start_codon:yes stop_codon:yes gene_type:complete